jgi:hypothetical protein
MEVAAQHNVEREMDKAGHAEYGRVRIHGVGRADRCNPIQIQSRVPLCGYGLVAARDQERCLDLFLTLAPSQLLQVSAEGRNIEAAYAVRKSGK